MTGPARPGSVRPQAGLGQVRRRPAIDARASRHGRPRNRSSEATTALKEATEIPAPITASERDIVVGAARIRGATPHGRPMLDPMQVLCDISQALRSPRISADG